LSTEQALDELLPEAFAVMSEAQRRFCFGKKDENGAPAIDEKGRTKGTLNDDGTPKNRTIVNSSEASSSTKDVFP
jgi:hypothetical protein